MKHPAVNPLDWELSPPDLPEADWVRAESAVELTRMGATPGAHPPRRLTRWLNAICTHHVGRSLDAAARLDPGLLLNSLVQAHESLRLENVGLQLGARAEQFAAVGRALSLRLAVELHSARPPAGSEAPSRQTLDELWARAFEIVRYGTASDLVHYGFLSPELMKGPCGLEHPTDQLFDDHSEEHAAALAAELGDPLSHALGLGRSVSTLTASELDREKALIARLDAAFEPTAGLRLLEMAKLVGQLAGLAGFRPHEQPATRSLGGFNCAGEETLAQVLSALLPGEPSAVRRALRFLSIGPRPDYPATEDKAWVYGRRRSFQSRPIVRHPDGTTLSWSGLHTYLCLDVIGSQLSYNSLPGVDDRSELGQAMGALSTWRGQVFQKQVLDVARADFRLRAKRLTSLDGEPLQKPDGDPLGDIDALIAVPKLRLLLALEAKAIAPARTPREFNNEITRFRATGKERTELDRHLMRVALVDRNRAAALRELDLPSDDAQQWHLHAAIVTQNNPVTGSLGDCPVPVISLATLRRLDLEDWARGFET